jgi:Ca-activated chloride channel family protein
VLLSDGETTVGRPNSDAAQAAVEAGVPVSTIAFGTPEGFVEIGGVRQPVPVDVEALEDIAEATGGRPYSAESAGELEEVYADIGSDVGVTVEKREVTYLWVLAALLLLMTTAASSLAAFGRLP